MRASTCNPPALPPMRSFRFGTASTPSPNWGSNRSFNRAARSATRKSSQRPTNTASRWCSPECATFATNRPLDPSSRMKILIVGGGGREHALAWKSAQSPRAYAVFVAPGNAGTALEPKVRNVGVPADDIDALLAFAQSEAIGLTIVGPEGPLVAGIADRFAAAGRACFGPSRSAARPGGCE